MHREWNSTYWGALLTRAESWTLTFNETELTVRKGGRRFRSSIDVVRKIRIRKGIIWSQVVIPVTGGRTESLGGIPNAAARELESGLWDTLRSHERERDLQELMVELEEQIHPIRVWYQKCEQKIEHHVREERWIAEETIQSLENLCPSVEYRGHELTSFLNEPRIEQRVSDLSQASRTAVEHWRAGIRAYVKKINSDFMESELVRRKGFFDSVERSPLTEEQARAVVCFDNRVQTVAAAGSGKTSTLIAKAGYAVHRNLVAPERILVLALNKNVAKELEARLEATLGKANISSEGIVVRTFHAFGLEVIGQATGRKPSLADGLDQDGGIKRLAGIIDGLKDADKGFRTQWDLFRLVFARDLPPFGKEDAEPEDWDRDSRRAGFRTLNGEVVKSQGERLIADWLFYNGVSYVYEPPYEHETADARHQQYHPDFYYPDAGLYHEHLALDAEGNPPPEFSGYMDGLRWKREVHAQYGTDLLETTTAELWSGDAFPRIEAALLERGIALEPNPDRPVPGREPIDHEALVKLFRTFLIHAKCNRLTDKELHRRVGTERANTFRYRHRRFVELFIAARQAWDSRLRDEGAIDFEDMLNLAVDHVEAGRWKSPYELVMVDEFQDASKARARLLRALVSGPGSYLFAVGDDWQSIYRFAGSDISVMTDFEEWFGQSQQCHLRQTFRCPQWLCDLSSSFVLKNPAQIHKNVVSAREEKSPRLRAFQVDNERDLSKAIGDYLTTLHEEVGGATSPESMDRETVYVLGRYNADRDLLPNKIAESLGDRLLIRFSTVHRAKGLEADHIVIPRLKLGVLGFPSNIEDDPVLHLAMPADDQVRNAEERRLFYVAVTRARESLAMFTISHQPSPFLVELAEGHGLEVVRTVDGQGTEFAGCPRCGRGALVERRGPNGKFLGCSGFPACRYTASLEESRS